MSGKFLTHALHTPLPARQKLVLITLGNLADEDGRFLNVDLEFLSVKCGMSLIKTNRSIIGLSDKGFIELIGCSDYFNISGLMTAINHE